VKIPHWVTQEEADGVWRLCAFMAVKSSSGLCRGHGLSWAEEALQLGFLMIGCGQTGTLFLPAAHSMHGPADLPYCCSSSLIYLPLILQFGWPAPELCHKAIRIGLIVHVSKSLILRIFFWLKNVFQRRRVTIILKGIAKNIVKEYLKSCQLKLSSQK